MLLLGDINIGVVVTLWARLDRGDGASANTEQRRHLFFSDSKNVHRPNAVLHASLQYYSAVLRCVGRAVPVLRINNYQVQVFSRVATACQASGDAYHTSIAKNYDIPFGLLCSSSTWFHDKLVEITFFVV